jgi:putative endonuclease
MQSNYNIAQIKSISDNNKSKYFVYILKCEFKGNRYNFYTGMTNSLIRRFLEHKDKKVKSTKRYKGNIKLVYYELANNFKEARNRELEIKKLSRKEKRKLIN